MRKLWTASLVTILVSVVSLVGLIGLTPSRVYADVKNDDCHKSSGLLGFPTWYEYLDVGPKGSDPCAIIGPADTTLGGELDFQKVLPRIALAIIEILLRIAGMVAVGMVIFAGFKYMTSQGEPDATKKAQSTAVNALIGLAVAVLASVIVSFVGRTLWL